MLSRLYRKHRELILYGIIGASGAALDLLVFWLLTTYLGWHPVPATAVSVSLGIGNNFVWNAFINFKTRDRLLLRFLSFFAIGLIGVLLSMLLIFLLHDVVSLDPLLAKLISIPVVVVGQFLANRSITFAKTPEEPSGS